MYVYIYIYTNTKICKYVEMYVEKKLCQNKKNIQRVYKKYIQSV